MSLTMWLTIAVLVMGALGGLSLGIYRTRTEFVVVAADDLSAFHAVSTGDVSLRKVAHSAIPAGAMRSLAAVRGHYALQPLVAGSVVTQAQVGPSAASTGMVVVPLPIDSDNLDEIGAGDRVDVLLAPNGQDGTPVVISLAEVVDEVTTAGGRQLVYLAVPCSREQAIAQVAGRGKVILTVAPGGRKPAG